MLFFLLEVVVVVGRGRGEGGERGGGEGWGLLLDNKEEKLSSCGSSYVKLGPLAPSIELQWQHQVVIKR